MTEEGKAVTLKRRKAIAVVLVFVMLLTSFCWTTEKAEAATAWYWPFDGYTSQSAAFSKISSSYGYRGRGFNRMHYGVDIAEARGKNVYAVRSGRVITAYNSTAGSAGRYIVIDHLDGYYSTYMHLSAVYVGVGTNVTQNTVIGAVGGSANGSETAYGAHLHLRISYGAANNAASINPCPLGYTRIGASFNDGVGYPVGEATISYNINRSATTAGCSHTYWKGSESAHPHKEFYKCSKCGYYYYTGVNFAGQISSCSICKAMLNKPTINVTVDGTTVNVSWNDVSTLYNYMYIKNLDTGNIPFGQNMGKTLSQSITLTPGRYRATVSAYHVVSEYGYSYNYVDFVVANEIKKAEENTQQEHKHDYVTGFESIHPHKGYKECTSCGDKQYTGKTNTASDCDLCNLTEKEEQECNHNYKIDYSIVHPHREYKMCLKCGDVEFTEKTTTLEDCKKCNPAEEKECQHTYKKKYETSHPHEIYYQCSKCGDKYGTGEYTEFDDCDQCLEEAAKVTAVQITGKAYDGYIKLNWTEQEALAIYIIYRSTDGKNFDEYDYTFDPSYYVDENVKPGNTYYYYVIVEGEVNKSEKSNICKVQLPSQSKSEKIRASIGNTEVKNLKAKKTGSKVKLTWKKSLSKYKVDGYFVLRSTKKNATYKKIKETTVRSCTVAKPKKGKTYYYMVFGYRIVDGEMINTIPARIVVKG